MTSPLIPLASNELFYAANSNGQARQLVQRFEFWHFRFNTTASPECAVETKCGTTQSTEAVTQKETNTTRGFGLEEISPDE